MYHTRHLTLAGVGVEIERAAMVMPSIVTTRFLHLSSLLRRASIGGSSSIIFGQSGIPCKFIAKNEEHFYMTKKVLRVSIRIEKKTFMI